MTLCMHIMNESIHNVATTAPPLLPILRSQAQARLLTALLLDPEQTWTVSSLAQEAGVSQPTATREIQRLERAGVVAVSGNRSARSITVDAGSPYYADLASLILKAFGPVRVVADALAGMDGVDEAWLFGSWARRYLGEVGGSPADIDLLVVGEPDLDALAAAATRSGSALGRPVGTTVLSPEEWADSASGFVRAVREGPRVHIPGGDE